jgi:tRNA 2-thiouridine synthesizing protein E
MNSYRVAGQHIPTDKEGYLTRLEDWSPEVAEAIANAEGIELTEAHWEILTLLRQFYEEFEVSPAMRPLVSYVSSQLGKDKGKSIYLLKLFPGSPAKVASKIAGLPRPANCL